MSGVKEKLAARFGGNIMESMGAGRAGGFALPTSGAIPGESAKYQGCTRIKSALSIQVDRIVPDPNQPRKEFEAESLRQLADSLRDRGQLQPIRVRWDAAMERWVIIAGERRWRAATLAELPAIAAVEAARPLTDDEILEEQLIENCVREDLRPIEQARAYKALIDSRGISQRQLAEKLRIAQATVAKALALLTLPEEIQASVDASEIGPTEAYQLSRVADPREQVRMAREARAGRLRRDDIEQRVRATRKGKGRGAAGAKAKKVTTRTFKTAGGPKVTVEFKKGLDGRSLVAALREALAQAEREMQAAGEAA
jgi:ParB family transcriptional regulator, chromosome partitioning protein